MSRRKIVLLKYTCVFAVFLAVSGAGVMLLAGAANPPPRIVYESFPIHLEHHLENQTEEETFPPEDGCPFSAFPFYQHEYLERYISFQYKTGLTPEETVWMVNVYLDKDFYSHIIEVNDPAPLLVNKVFKLPDNFVPLDLVTLASGREVTAATRDAFLKMQEEARKQGFIINDVSCYRSITRQRELYNRYLQRDPRHVVDTYSARPGHSEHHTGRAIDVAAADGSINNFGNTREYTWVVENAQLFGFIVRYKKGFEHITGYMFEPWHLTYVGAEIAVKMRDSGIHTLEEFVGRGLD